jgi:hypothetical protein
MLLNLKCNHNTKLQAIEIPHGLLSLSCIRCNLTSLANLPDNMTYLECGLNKELSRITNIPVSLKILACFECPLEVMPNLPDTLEDPNIANTKIKRLPNIPDGLKKLNTSGLTLEYPCKNNIRSLRAFHKKNVMVK